MAGDRPARRCGGRSGYTFRDGQDLPRKGLALVAELFGVRQLVPVGILPDGPLSAQSVRAKIKTQTEAHFPERWLSGRKHRFAKAA
jgi:hypothetical protein